MSVRSTQLFMDTDGCALSLSNFPTILEHYPKHLAGYEVFARMFRDLAKGIAHFQDEEGAWRNALDLPSERSTMYTGCNAYGFLKGYRLGLLDKEYRDPGQAAWQFLKKRIFTGGLIGFPGGTTHLYNRFYYQNRTINYDYGSSHPVHVLPLSNEILMNQDIVLRDVQLFDAPGFGVWPIGCERMTIHGITLHNDRGTPNGDGIQICCSRDVRISDCSIYAGDDCICMYTGPYWLGTSRPCENVTVTNCTLSTRCCGVRIGYVGDAPIRNFTISNIVMYNCRAGIDMLCTIKNPWKLECEAPTEHGPLIENISFSNIVMDSRMAIYLWIGDDARRPAGIRNTSIADVIATTTHACYIGGSKQLPVDGVRISNLKLTMKGEVDDRHANGVAYPISPWGCLGIPHAFYFRHARNVELNNVRVDWGDATGPWRSALRAEDVEGLDVNGFIARHSPASPEAATVHLTDMRGAWLRGCRAEAGTGTFLRLEGATSSAAMTGNELSLAREAVQLGERVPADALRAYFESGL